jgi:hypothetical protein
MQEPERGPNFVIGNIILGVCVVMLLFIESLWQYLGMGALVLWMLLAAAGMYLILTEKRNPHMPD